MTFTETELTDFISNVKQRGQYYASDTSFNSFLQDTIDFLTGKATQIIYKPTYYFGYCFEPIFELLPTNTADWQEKHELVLAIANTLWQAMSYNFWYRIERINAEFPEQNTLEFYFQKLIDKGFKEVDLMKDMVARFYYQFLYNNQSKVSNVGAFILEKLKTNEKDTLQGFYNYPYAISYLVQLLFLKEPQLAEKLANKLLKHSGFEKGSTIDKYLEYDAKKYEPECLKVINNQKDAKSKIDGYNLLNEHLKDKYKDKSLELWYEYLDWYVQETTNSQRSYFYEHTHYIYDKKATIRVLCP